jgi:hypothetical protein
VSKLLSFILMTLFLAPASTDNKYVITHYNITFAPDLSNRVNPKLNKRPLNDVDLLKIITTNLYPNILNERRSQYQQDKLLVDFINKGLIGTFNIQTDKLLIDFGQFPTQLERINYVLMNKPPKRTLTQDISKMNKEFDRVYSNAIKNNVGADVWTYFDQGIDDKNVLQDDKPKQGEDYTYVNHYRNILILPTDGYVEAGIFGKGYDLAQQTINRFRKAFLESGETDLQKFYRKNTIYHIKPARNLRLKNLEVLVMEMYDRSLTTSGSATVHPTDMEIMKIFWTDWLQKSGVKHFELHPIVNSRDEAQKIILNFMNISKTH